jgi:alkanesulfonate monooxygenase SsuD/methylene tetrahydromethanopterin reductase-like flavin-dependent oxidoreductase (luciferase family)
MFEEVARTAERGGFDMIFFGDSTGILGTWKESIEDATSYGVAWPLCVPTTSSGALNPKFGDTGDEDHQGSVVT